MAIPKISMPCFLAQLSKAVQQSPDDFSAEFMMRMNEEQPELMSCIVAMLQPMVDMPEGIEVPADVVKEMCLVSTFCVMGVVLESISATIDAEEMDEAWS